MDGTALKTRSHQKYQNEKRERQSGELQARTLACRAITRLVRGLCPLGHGSVLAKSMTFITSVDVLHAVIQILCNLNQNCGLIISKCA